MITDLPQVLRPAERERLRVPLDGALALAKRRGGWRAYRDAVFCLVLLGAAPRVSEECDLHRSDAFVEGGERRLVIRNGKGGRRRKVRLADELRLVLRGYLDAFPCAEAEAPVFPPLHVNMSETLAPPETPEQGIGQTHHVEDRHRHPHAG